MILLQNLQTTFSRSEKEKKKMQPKYFLLQFKNQVKNSLGGFEHVIKF